LKHYAVVAVAALVVLMMVPLGSMPAFAAGQDYAKINGIGFAASDIQGVSSFESRQLSSSCAQNLDGHYILSVNSNTYALDMIITGNNATGNYPSGPGPYLFTWHAKVGVVGNAVTINMAYDAPSTYTTVLAGTIAPDGSMNGTGTNGISDWNITPVHLTSCNRN